MANYDKQFNVNKGLSVKGTTVIDENRNVAAAALTVTSNTLVTNLNAEMVGGKTVSLLGVTNANSVISGAWDFQTAPLFSGGASGYPPFAVSAGSTMVTNLNAEKIADKAITSLGVIDAARTISATWTYTAAPFFNTVGEPFTVASTTKVANLNADLLDGANADTGDVVSTIAMRDSSGNLTAKQFSMTAGPSSRTTDTVFYSGAANDIYKNTLVGFKTSLGLNLVDNVSINSWTGSANIVTLGAATSSGKITANTFKSNVATGTAPFEVSSLTMVTNLNAEMVGGLTASSFLSSATQINIGTTTFALNRAAGAQLLTGVSIDGTATNVTGTVAIGKGGTGLTTVGSSGQILFSNGNAMYWGTAPTSFPGFGTTSGLAAAGDHTHSQYISSGITSLSLTAGFYATSSGSIFRTNYTAAAPSGGIAGSGFVVGSTSLVNYTAVDNVANAMALIITGGGLEVKSALNGTLKPIYGGTIYSDGIAVSLTNHTHSYLPLAGGTITGNLSISGTLTAPSYSTTTLYLGSTGILPTSGTVTANARIYLSGTETNYHADTHTFKAKNGGTSAAVTINGALTVTGNTTASALYGTSVSVGTVYGDTHTGKTFNTASKIEFDSFETNKKRIAILSDYIDIRGSGWAATTYFNVGAWNTNSSTIGLYGNTYIGTSTTSRASLTVWGDLWVAGTVNLANTTPVQWTPSDIRLKREIRQIDSSKALHQISQIELLGGVIGYKMNTDEIDAPEKIGVSAQIIAKIVPQASSKKAMLGNGVEHYMWHSEQITALLISAVARLNERLTILEESLGLTQGVS